MHLLWCSTTVRLTDCQWAVCHSAYSRKHLYDQAMVPVCTRDRIVLFTDGITEACTKSNDEFGEQGLAAAFDRCGWLTASELKDRIIDALTRTCGASLSDDATLVVVAAG